jgi:hypothetical protein
VTENEDACLWSTSSEGTCLQPAVFSVAVEFETDTGEQSARVPLCVIHAQQAEAEGIAARTNISD